jgi:RNA polymerase-binding transcription factor DksA
MLDINYFKTKLEEEKTGLEKDLSKIAHRNPQDSEDWQTTPEDLNIMISDKNELADVFEESANKEAVEKELEEKLNKVKDAIQKIKGKTYGICKEGCKIEEKRLRADPTALTCIKHSKSA